MCFTKKLFVKKSTLPGAGRGLFTRVDIPEGSLICEYYGKLSLKSKSNKNSDYVLELGQGKVIDALRTKHVGRFANDARGISRLPGVGNNSYYDGFGSCMAYIRAARRIKAGEEIFVKYGKPYWDIKRARALLNGSKM